MTITMIGLDGAKPAFQIHALDDTARAKIRRKLSRNELIPVFQKQEGFTIVLEACGAAHHWAPMLTGLGHEVKLIARLAKAYVCVGAVFMTEPEISRDRIAALDSGVPWALDQWFI